MNISTCTRRRHIPIAILTICTTSTPMDRTTQAANHMFMSTCTRRWNIRTHTCPIRIIVIGTWRVRREGEEEASFLKKRSKKLLMNWAGALRLRIGAWLHPRAHRDRFRAIRPRRRRRRDRRRDTNTPCGAGDVAGLGQDALELGLFYSCARCARCRHGTWGLGRGKRRVITYVSCKC